MDWIFLFVVTVWKMRKFQIAYFNDGRKQSDLIEAKRYERMVDDELKKKLVFAGDVPTGLDTGEELRPTEEPKQTTLFE